MRIRPEEIFEIHFIGSNQLSPLYKKIFAQFIFPSRSIDNPNALRKRTIGRVWHQGYRSVRSLMGLIWTNIVRNQKKNRLFATISIVGGSKSDYFCGLVFERKGIVRFC